MRQVVSVVTGGGPCSKDCPYYAEEGWVRGVNGVPLKTHCRGTMQDIIVDCDKFNTQTVEKMEVTDEQWKTMQKAVGKHARKGQSVKNNAICMVLNRWRTNHKIEQIGEALFRKL